MTAETTECGKQIRSHFVKDRTGFRFLANMVDLAIKLTDYHTCGVQSQVKLRRTIGNLFDFHLFRLLAKEKASTKEGS